MAAFTWDGQTELAAQLVANGELTDTEIATEIGRDYSTLWRWRQNPEFAAKVEEHLERIRATLRRRAVSMAEKRVNRLNRDWVRLQRVIEERGEDASMASVPGGTTGLVCRTIKGVGRGEDFQLVETYEVDTGTLRELRDIEKQAAQELGQWVEREMIEDARKSYEATNTPDAL